jgi:NAD(P)-dependent dehydrogenase (short-subunit alcohol dehydrogenase family)
MPVGLEWSPKEERLTLGRQRRGHTEEVVAAVVFLCSKQASFVTRLNM